MTSHRDKILLRPARRLLFKRIARGRKPARAATVRDKVGTAADRKQTVGHVAVGQTALREPTPLSRRLAAVSPRRTCEDGLAGLYSSLRSAGGGAEESNKGHGGRGAPGMLEGQLDGLGHFGRGHTTYILKRRGVEAVLVTEDPLGRVVRRVGNWHHVGGSALLGLVLFRSMESWTAWSWLLNVVFRTASSWFSLEFGLWIKSPTYTLRRRYLEKTKHAASPEASTQVEDQLPGRI
ncbi:hypothetical protein BGZ61DRAFT_481812 [Ilyonectria robusta]|uniref:uncharacterized protein n=1 Tax=Ilyonectria robusta TaxID=1079257 RepID=UPI001E8D9533|nr:uncharacterized protein BGZ61DRAFT_481812 [Ilyonectria robusta]KAH8677220.1 hypothetical protein BGZ61DRAFT_481812 [Ilyonectria robusta]